MIQKARYQSPSTDGVAHDIYNLIVEAIMINRYGMIPSGSWRKGAALHEEWSGMVKIVKRLLGTMKIDPKKLAWYIKKFSVGSLDYEEFGLVRYKINRSFGWENLEEFCRHYTTIYKSKIGESSSYVEQSTTYKTKEPTTPKKRSLQDILQEIENASQG